MDTPTVVLGFDMETDIGSWTPFYEGFVHGTPRILEVLERHGVSATFYVTGIGAKTHPEVVRTVRDAGHEIGAHSLYHETVGEAFIEIPGVYPLLPEEVEHRLALCTAWVEEVAGVRPVSFRCPRLFGSTAVTNALESLGYATDATYPLYYYQKHLAPYHPHPEDWTREGSLALWELPNFADMGMETADPLGRDRDQWPIFRTESAEALLAHVDSFRAYAAARGVPPFLCFYFHPWEFHEMPQGEIRYGEGAVRPDPFIVKNCGAYAIEQLDALVGALRERGAVFKQAREIGEGESP